MTGQIVMPHGIVKMTDVKYDSLSGLIGAPRLGGSAPFGQRGWLALAMPLG